jgi:hypothetical protein
MKNFVGGYFLTAYTGLMRALLQFLGFCFIVFFVVGEFRGWYVGMATQTPMLLYKGSQAIEVTRDVLYEDQFDFDLRGKINDGTVRVEAFFEIPPSFQTGTAGKAPKKVFDEEFGTGQDIQLNEILKSGKGRYTVRILYENVTGIFRMNASGQGRL